METIRDGHTFGFRILALQTGLGWARVADSVPSGWDAEHRRPVGGCGAARIVASAVDTIPLPPDRRLLARARTFADSVLQADSTIGRIRASAWCFIAQVG